MKKVFLIFRREFTSYFRSYMGYIILAVVLLIDGLLFNVYALGGGYKFSADVLREFFYFSSGTTMIASVFLSMRLLAEERMMGTIILYNSSPVKDYQIVLGKFFSALVFLLLMTLLTLYMPMLIFVNGNVSMGHIFGGYLGLLALGATSLAIGIFGSALAPNQIVAAIISAALIVSMLLFWMLATIMEPPLSGIFSYLALHSKHFTPFMRGIVNSRDLLFYLSLTYFFLLLSIKILEARRWR